MGLSVCSYGFGMKFFFVLNFVLFACGVVSIVFGVRSLDSSTKFARLADDYCKQQCLLTKAQYEVGCNCRALGNGKTTIAASILHAPGVGGVLFGLSLLAITVFGMYCSGKGLYRGVAKWMFFMIAQFVAQLGIGAAGLAVATGTTGEITGPIFDVMRVGNPPNYKRFNWAFFEEVLKDKDCHAGRFVEYDVEWTRPVNVEFYHPLCGFDGECVPHNPSVGEQSCCYEQENKCAYDQVGCNSGKECLLRVFRRIGLLIGIVFMLIVGLELVTLFTACAIRAGPPMTGLDAEFQLSSPKDQRDSGAKQSYEMETVTVKTSIQAQSNPQSGSSTPTPEDTDNQGPAAV